MKPRSTSGDPTAQCLENLPERIVRLLFVTIALTVALACALTNFRPAPPVAVAAAAPKVIAQQPRTTERAPARFDVGDYVGLPSCASDRCHGGSQQATQFWRKSYSLWLDGHEGRADRPADPHQHAYARLRPFDPQEVGYKIVARLKPDAVKSEAAYRRFLAERCNACHITTKPANSATPAYKHGVSCESCHGPAGGWLIEHTTNQWITMSDEEKRRRQFQPLTDLNERAATCVGCHVGRPAKTSLEVDHDLIAAGHPRLNFDLRSYHERLPEHWDRAADEQLARTPNVPFQLGIWQAGRRAELLQALELLEQRADRAAKRPQTANWPEFAEYSCYACHHELVRGGFRQQLLRAGHSPGQFDWGAWHSIYVEFLPEDVQQPLQKLTVELNQPLPDELRVVQLCQQTRQQLSRAQTNVDGEALKVRLAASEYTQMDWDRAKRWWSAWLAVTSGMPDAAAERREMESSFFHTQQGAGPMNDREYSGILELQFQSPVHFDPAAFEQMRQRVIDASGP